MNVGDIVKIVNRGARYTSYTDFFREHKIDWYLPEYVPDCKLGQEGEIIFIGLHAYRDKLLYLVRLDHGLILIGDYGLRVIRPAEIELDPIEPSDLPVSFLIGG